MPVLLIIGQADHTFIGKDVVPKDKQKLYGDFQVLGRKAHRTIKNSELIELPGVGHIPHIQSPALFNMYILKFCSNIKLTIVMRL